MAVGSFTNENVLAFPPSKVWKASVVDGHNLLHKILPEVIASVEIIEGDGGVGTIRKFNIKPDMKNITFVKERTDAIDHEKHVFKYTILDGELIGKKFKTYSFEICIEPTAEGGSKTKVTCVYDTIDGETLTEDHMDAKSKATFWGLVMPLKIICKQTREHIIRF